MNGILRKRMISGAATVIFAAALLIGGAVATRLKSPANGIRLRAVSYASVVDNAHVTPGSVSVQQLAEDMCCLVRNGASFVTPTGLYAYESGGTAAGDCIMLVFEYADAAFFDEVVPILRECNARAVLIVDGNELMTYSDAIAALHDEGIIETALCAPIGSASAVTAAAALSDARLELIKLLGIEDAALAYRAAITRMPSADAFSDIRAAYEVGSLIVYGDGSIERAGQGNGFIVKRLPRSVINESYSLMDTLFP